MQKPKMIIFDYGNTLVYEKKLDMERGFHELYTHITEKPAQFTFSEFYTEGSAIWENVNRRAVENDVEIHCHNIFNAIFHSLNIRLGLPYTELETVFWEALAPAMAMPNAEKMLDYLKAENIRTAVISNIVFSEKALTVRLNTYLPKNGFEFVIASSEYGFRKPDAVLFKTALKKANLTPEEVWYCGDNPRADVIGSAGAGLRPFLFESDLKCPYMNDSHIVPDCEFTRVRDWTELTDILKTGL